MILQEEKDFKKDIFLYKNKKYKAIPINSNKKVKQSRIKNILYCINSDLYGYSYITLTPKIYKKLQAMKDIKFSYKFLDGEMVDNDEFSESDIWVKNVYYYDSTRDLFSKLYEIVVEEYCLNEQFWVFDSFYSYMFSDYKVSFKYKGKYFKFNDLKKFYNFIFGSYSLFNNKTQYNDGLLSFSEKRFKYLPRTDLIKKSKYRKFYKENKDSTMMYTMHSSQFVYINPKFFRNIKSVEVESDLWITELNGVDALEVLDSYIQNNITYTYDNYDICILYMIACSPLIINNLGSSNCEMIKYCTKNKTLSINGKKIKKKKDRKFNRLFKRWFPGVKYSSF